MSSAQTRTLFLEGVNHEKLVGLIRRVSGSSDRELNMQTRSLLKGALLGAAALASVHAGMPGSYQDAEVTTELQDLLYSALQNGDGYRDEVSIRLCVSKVISVDQQVVAGTNYRFTTNACDVEKTLEQTTNATPSQSSITSHSGSCDASFAENCVGGSAIITIYQSLDDSLEVSSVEFAEERGKVHAVEM